MVITGPVAAAPAPVTTPIRTIITPSSIRIIPAVTKTPAPGKSKTHTGSVIRISIIITYVYAGSIAIWIVIVPIAIGIITIIISNSFQRIMKSLNSCSIRIVIIIILGIRAFIVGFSFQLYYLILIGNIGINCLLR